MRGLTKVYGAGAAEVRALAGVDLDLYGGELVVLLGPSGSGKTTLLNNLGGLDVPTAGELWYRDLDLTAVNEDELTRYRRDTVGFVFQFFNLLPTLSAEENIALPLIIDGQDLRKYQSRINTLLELVGLTDRRRHKPDQLSGGEQQRVALARALITEPAIVLADEPTGNLDSKTGTAIMDLLRRSCDELGQTVIVVTHDSRAAAYADRAVFLKDGQIVRQVAYGTVVDMAQRLRIVLETMEELQK